MQNQEQTQEQSQDTEQFEPTELTVETKVLKRAVKQLKRSINRSSDDMPILAGIRFKPVTNNKLELFATNLETATRLKIDVHADRVGSPFIVKGYKLDRVLKKESGTCNLSTIVDQEEDGYTFNKVRFRIDGINYDLFRLEEDFPNQAEADPDKLIGIFDKNKFQDMVYTVNDFALRAKSEGTTRISLTGVKLEDGQAIATNGYIMMIENSFGTMDGSALMGPANQLKKIRPTLKRFDGDTIELYKIKNNGKLDLLITDDPGNHQLFIGDIMEEFPEYEAVIPEDNDIPIQPKDPDKIKKFTDKMSRMLDTEAEAVDLKVKGQTLELTAGGPETGTFSTKVEIDRPTNPTEEIHIKFKADYINRIFDNSSKDLTIWLLDSETAGLFDDENSAREFVLMPISLEG